MNADFQRRVEENSDWNETSYTRVKDEVLALLREEIISKDEAKQLIETLDLVSSIKLRQEFTNQLKQNRLSAEEYNILSNFLPIRKTQTEPDSQNFI